jgi:ABC-type dipeptide/oligopeptide/nickel transport system permease subunit
VSLARPRLGPAGFVAIVALGVMLVGVAFGPTIWTVDPNRTQLTDKFSGPKPETPLGTDEFGRDLLSRLLHGGRLSVFGALVVVVGCSALGLLIGTTASMVGGWVDVLLGRFVDGLLTLPALVVALAIAGVLGKSFGHVLLALILTEWPWYARVYRSLFLSELHRPYVLAARAVGANSLRIVVAHVLRNVAGPALVVSSTNLGAAILSLTALSFLGLGVQPPEAEWGAMVSGGRLFFQTAPWVIVAPALAIGITAMAVNLLGDSLGDLADPRRARS